MFLGGSGKALNNIQIYFKSEQSNINSIQTIIVANNGFAQAWGGIFKLQADVCGIVMSLIEFQYMFYLATSIVHYKVKA